jgi:hypothetical protein
LPAGIISRRFRIKGRPVNSEIGDFGVDDQNLLVPPPIKDNLDKSDDPIRPVVVVMVAARVYVAMFDIIIVSLLASLLLVLGSCWVVLISGIFRR